jgi:hypothetical protein
MKSKKNIFGIIVFLAIIMLATASCWSPAGDSTGPDNKGSEIKVVDIAAITGVTVPVTGETPAATITGNDQYSGTVTWEPDHSVFESKTHYTATIILTAKEGYTLEGVAANFFTVAEALSVSNDANSGIVTAAFPSTAGTETDPVVIESAVIEGITAPVTGGTPVTVFEHAQYTGTVTWEPDHSVFEPKTEYTATITLTAKPGFTLQGVSENFFTVEDAISASNSAGSGIVTVVFPSTAGTSTDPAVIDIAVLEGITAPVTGGTPAAHITGNAQYTGTVTWEPNHSTFAPKTEYTATITLTAKEGFTLQGVGADFFTIEDLEDVISISNAANSGVITIVFPSTAGTSTGPATIDIAAIHGVTAPVINGYPVTHITETEQYTGTVEWLPAVASRGIRIVCYDSMRDGWDGGGAIRLTINGNPVSTQLKATGSGTAYTLGAATAKNGDVVRMYWVKGTAQQENSFVVYYNDLPPSPAFDPNSWSGSNVLVYMLYDSMTSLNTDDLIGEFTVALPPPVFLNATQYTATITLTPKEGYTLEGVEADFFTVAGAASVNNAADSGVITAAFPRTAYLLGDTGPGGGRIFYISEEGFTMTDTDEIYHYLEAAPANMSTTLAWASTGFTSTSIPDAKYPTGDPIGAGRKNTAAILAIDPDAPAAKACAEYSNNGMTDWFLPSYQELLMLNTNMSYVGNMGSYQYWSSTESMTDDSNVFSYYFSFMSVGQGKGTALRVRAIRAF